MTKQLSLLAVIGTRPELIKFLPLLARLSGRKHRITVGLTGQHKFEDYETRDLVRLCGLPKHLHAPSWTPGGLITALESWLPGHETNGVMALGDTTSVMATAVVCSNLGMPFIHVEAGMRSGTLQEPCPEEAWRRMADSVADVMLAPTHMERLNLLREDRDGRRIAVCGSTSVDALLGLRLRKPRRRRNLVVITCHRRENIPRYSSLMEQVFSLASTHKTHDFLWIGHQNPRVQEAWRQFAGDSHSGVSRVPPLPHRQMASLLAEASCVITDSGGVVEECSFLKTPCIVFREHTERIHAEKQKCARRSLTGIGSACSMILEDVEGAVSRIGECPYGDGTAADKMVQALEKLL